MSKNYSKRFEDNLSLEVPQWVVNLFVNIVTFETVDLQIHEELIELSTNEILQASVRDGEHLTEFFDPIYPVLWTVINKLLIAFPFSYLAERGFSTVTDLITKKKKMT